MAVRCLLRVRVFSNSSNEPLLLLLLLLWLSVSLLVLDANIAAAAFSLDCDSTFHCASLELGFFVAVALLEPLSSLASRRRRISVGLRAAGALSTSEEESKQEDDDACLCSCAAALAHAAMQFCILWAFHPLPQGASLCFLAAGSSGVPSQAGLGRTAPARTYGRVDE